MNICHVITGLGVGGAENTLVRLVEGLPATTFQNVVVSLIAEGPLAIRLRRAGAEVRSLNMPVGIPHPAGMLRLMGLLARERPDIVHTWLYHADLIGLLAAGVNGIRKVLWSVRCSDMDLRRYRRTTSWTRALNSRLAHLPRAVLFNSNAAARYHYRIGYRPRCTVIIPNGFDTERFKPDPHARQTLRREIGVPADAPLVGMVARIDPMKDHVSFVRAAARISAYLPRTRFVLCGRGCSESNGALVNLLASNGMSGGMSGKVRLLGMRPDVQRVFAALDLHVLASRSESCPNVVGESLACGVPNVVADVGAARLLTGRAGRVVPAGDADALAKAMLELLLMPSVERIGLGRIGRRHIMKRFSLRSFVARHEALYHSVAEGCRP